MSVRAVSMRIPDGMVVVGLTGGIASGKSFVAGLLAARGLPLIDADTIGRDLLASDPVVRRRVAAGFGLRFVDDRPALARRVFSRVRDLRLLERILHPAITARIEDCLQARAGRHRLVIIEIPLLFEAGLATSLSRSVVVWSPEVRRIRRLMDRSGMTHAAALRRVRLQMPLARKISLADFVIDNSGARSRTRRAVDALADVLTNLSS